MKWPPWLVPTLLVGWFFALLLAWGGLVLQDGGVEAYTRRPVDFTCSLAAAELIRSGRGGELYVGEAQEDALRGVFAPYRSLEEGELLPYLRPPFEAVLLAPMPAGAAGATYAAWAAASMLAFGAAVALIAKTLADQGRGLDPARIAWVVSFYPVVVGWMQGQTTSIIFLGVALAWAGCRTGRTWMTVAGIAAVSLKPQMLPMVLLLVASERRWRDLLGGIGAIALASVLVMPLVGVDWPLQWVDWVIQESARARVAAIEPRIMPNLRSITNAMLPRAEADAVAAIASALAYVAAALCFAKQRPVDPDARWAFGVVVALLAGHHVNPPDLALVGLAALWIPHPKGALAAAMIAVWFLAAAPAMTAAVPIAALLAVAAVSSVTGVRRMQSLTQTAG